MIFFPLIKEKEKEKETLAETLPQVKQRTGMIRIRFW